MGRCQGERKRAGGKDDVEGAGGDEKTEWRDKRDVGMNVRTLLNAKVGRIHSVDRGLPASCTQSWVSVPSLDRIPASIAEFPKKLRCHSAAKVSISEAPIFNRRCYELPG